MQKLPVVAKAVTSAPMFHHESAGARFRAGTPDGDARYALELVRTICARVGPGIPGSARERERASALAAEMRSHLGAGNVAVEEFEFAPRAWLGVFPIGAALMLAAALANVVSPRLTGTTSAVVALAALVLSVLPPALWLLEFVLGFEVVDRFFPRGQSVNVIGTLRKPGTGEPTRLLILSAHHDSAPENRWLALLGYAGLAASAIPFVAFVVLPALCVVQLAGITAGNAEAIRTGTLGWGLLAGLVLPAAIYGAFFNRGWKNGGTVPGAADNLSGCAVVVAMSKILAANTSVLPDDAEIRFVMFGSEEAGLRGSRRYVARHLDELERKRVRVLNFDTIAHPTMGILSSDVNGSVKCSKEMVEALVAAARRTGVPHEVKRAFLGVATDAGPFCRAGLAATTIIAFEVPRQLVAFYHQKSDRPDVVDPDALSNALKIARAWLEDSGR